MKKCFGQNLLSDKNYLEKIVDSIDLNPVDTILEIGSGSGLLTCLLASKVKKVLAVELERDILKKLKITTQSITNIEIINSDFLKLDLTEISNKPFKIIGNIPYNITSKILLKLFGEIDNPAKHLQFLEKVYLMVQLEVAERLVAKPNTKAYSPLTLLVQYFSSPEILFKVPKGAFFPVPKVDSAFVKFDMKKKLQPLKDPTLLKNIIRISFQQRRKKAINALNKLIEDKGLTEKVFNELHLSHNLRPENLSFEDFIKISDKLKHQ